MSKIERNIPSRALVALSANLKTIAQERQWDTQARIGKEIGLDQKAAGRILNAENEPRLDTLTQIADKINVSEAALLLPNMGLDQYLSNQSISDPLRALIEQLIALDKAGDLTAQVLSFLQMGIDMAVHTVPQQDKSVKVSTQ